MENKICPKCHEKNNPVFSKCWKCGTNFISVEDCERKEEGGVGHKKCPYCAEAIKEAAIKCKYCGSELAPQNTATVQAVNRKSPMKTFLIFWTFLTAVVLALFLFGSISSLNQGRQNWYKEMELTYGKKPGRVNFNDGGEHDVYVRVVSPAFILGVMFWGIPVALGSLIIIASRKK